MGQMPGLFSDLDTPEQTERSPGRSRTPPSGAYETQTGGRVNAKPCLKPQPTLMQGNDRPPGNREGIVHGGPGHLFWGSQDLMICFPGEPLAPT